MMLLRHTRLNLSHFINSQSIWRGSYTTQSKIPINVLEGFISAHKQASNGVVYDKKPFKMKLEVGKKYSWCTCGKSKNQPFCDGTHKDVFLKITLRPIRFAVEETKDYWLCNCKQTNSRPFCDGSHTSQFVQESTSTIRQ